MFIPLVEQNNENAMSVCIWSEDGSEPFNEFLRELKKINDRAAGYLVVYIQYMMKYGAHHLAASLPVPGYTPLRLAYAGDVWLAYFYEPCTMYICEQGFEETARSEKMESASTRMSRHKHAALTNEKVI